MGVDVSAVLRIGWVVDHDEAANYGELEGDGFEALESIEGVGDGYDWVDRMDEYSFKSPVAIGWQPAFRKGDPNGSTPYATVPLSTEEFASQFHDQAKDEAARKVYEAVTGYAPSTDPAPVLYERWW